MRGAFAVTMTIGLLAGCASSGTRSGDTGSAEFVGFKWAITEVHHAGVATTIPAVYGASISFGPDELLYADDGVNSSFGRYTVDGSAYRAHEIGTTAVGVVHPAPALSALIDAVRAVTQEGVEVTGRVTGDQLTLSASDYQLVCVRDGVQSTEPPPSPTPSATDD